MRITSNWVRSSFILVLLIISLNSLIIANAEFNTKLNTYPVALITNKQNIDVHYVFQSGSHVSISLDYDFSTTTQLDTNEFLSILLVFTDNEEDPLDGIDAAILFFHTATNQFLLFWMIGDPFHQTQMWQLGVEFQHFQVDKDLLIIDLIEFTNISDHEIKLIVMGKILANFELDGQVTDFRMILDQFLPELNVGYETIYQPTSKSSTTKKKASGFLFIYTISILLLCSIIVSKKRQR
jgi:hypothetical protein